MIQLWASARFVVDPHTALDFPERSEQRLDGFRRGAVEEEEKALLIALFGRKKQVPLLKLFEEKCGKCRRKTVQKALVDQSLDNRRKSARSRHI